jgi:hypothetical protein
MTNISCPCKARTLLPCQVASVLRTSKSALGVRRAKAALSYEMESVRRLIRKLLKPYQFRQVAAQLLLAVLDLNRDLGAARRGCPLFGGRVVNICAHQVFRILTQIYGPAARCKSFSSIWW